MPPIQWHCTPGDGSSTADYRHSSIESQTTVSTAPQNKTKKLLKYLNFKEILRLCVILQNIVIFEKFGMNYCEEV